MTRRDLLASIAVVARPARADSAADAWDLIAAMAAALAEDNAPGFLNRIDPQMPDFSALARDIQAMIEQADVHSVIAPLDNQGDESARTLQLDWELHLTRKGEPTRTQVREESVTAQLRRVNKKWRIVKLEPLAFFAPPGFR